MSLKFFNSKYQSSEMINTAVQLALMILFWGARAYIRRGTLQITSCFLLHFFFWVHQYTSKVHIFWEGHNNLTKYPNLFFWSYLVSSKKFEDFGKLFIYSEEATKIWRNLRTLISKLFLTLLSKFKITLEISSDFCGCLRIYEL